MKKKETTFICFASLRSVLFRNPYSNDRMQAFVPLRQALVNKTFSLRVKSPSHHFSDNDEVQCHRFIDNDVGQCHHFSKNMIKDSVEKVAEIPLIIFIKDTIITHYHYQK